MNLKERAQLFLKTIVRGQIDEAFEKYTTPNFKHHNLYNKGDRDSLKKGMKESEKMFPNKVFDIKKVIGEGNLVSMYSHVKLQQDKPGIAVMHMVRFEQDMIAEMWDIGVQIPEDCPNENGAF